MNNYNVIGQIKGAKVVTRKNKTTGIEVSTTEVIIQVEDYDKNGELVLDTDTISFPISDLNKFKENVNKFISVPYLFISTPKGSWLFPNEEMIYTIYDKHPLHEAKVLIK